MYMITESKFTRVYADKSNPENKVDFYYEIWQMKYFKHTLLFVSLLTPLSCTFANPPTGQNLIRILLDNKDQVIPNKDKR